MPVLRGAARMAMSLMRRMSSTTSTLEGTQAKIGLRTLQPESVHHGMIRMPVHAEGGAADVLHHVHPGGDARVNQANGVSQCHHSTCNTVYWPT